MSLFALGCLCLLPPNLLSAQRASFGPAAAAVERGIRRGLYPGAVLVIGRRDTILFARGFGKLTWSRKSARPSAWTTLWDLASLTKVVATTGVLAVLVDHGAVDLDAPVARYLPRFQGGGKELVTVRMLLQHTSGLRAYVPLHARASSREEAIDHLYAEPLARWPGSSAEYSDLNALLLGLLIESVTGEPLSRVATELVFDPLRMGFTTFMPLLPEKAIVAPSHSERGRPVPRVVDDANARRFGGVAGHAGLYSTGLDLAKYAQVWLRRGTLPAGPWVSRETVAEFLTPTPAGGSRLLGWDSPERDTGKPSVFGRLTSPSAFGHTGWTGTLLWIDPDRDLFLIFLTNRSLDPRRRNSITALRDLRAEVSDLATRAALAQCGGGLGGALVC
ncbi:MAG: serine hydrolase domain-containing protein [Gemmatimonadales bacterium]